jgi:hypothetical protein
MNENVPYIWRKNYRNEAASPEKVLDVAHDKASQYLRQAAAMATKAASSPSSVTARSKRRVESLHQPIGAVKQSNALQRSDVNRGGAASRRNKEAPHTAP